MVADAPDSDTPPYLTPGNPDLLSYLHALDGVRTPVELFETTYCVLSQWIPFDRMAIGMATERERVFRTRWQTGVDLGLPDGYETLPADSRSLTGRALETRRTALHSVPSDHDVYRGDPLRRSHGIRHVLIAPMYLDDQVYGVLKLYSTATAAFTQDHAGFAEHVGRLLGHTLARIDQRARIAVLDDELTFTESVLQLAQTDGLDSLRMQLTDEVATRTGTTVLRFDMLPGGLSQVAHRRLPAMLTGAQTVEEIAAILTQPVRTHVARDLGTENRAVFYTNDVSEAQTSLPVVPLDPVADPFDVSSVLLTALPGSDGIPQTVFLVAWPGEADVVEACRHAEHLTHLLDKAEPAFTRLHELESLKRQVAEMDTIRRLIDTVARTPTMQNALETICRSAQLMTGLEFVAVAEVLTGHVVWKAATGARDTDFLNRRLPVPEHILTALIDREPELIIDDIRLDPEFTPEIMPVHTSEQLRSTVIVPVHVNARLRAAMVGSQRHPHSFTHSELSLIRALAGAVATAFAANDARLSGPNSQSH